MPDQFDIGVGLDPARAVQRSCGETRDHPAAA